MPTPIISVLLPMKNAEETVAAAIRSILTQTLQTLELLIIDDGSTDHSHQVVLAAAQGDPRVQCFRGPGRGIAQALTFALSKARAPLIARMDADDESLPLRLERSVDFLARHPDLAGVGTQVEVFRDDQPVSPNMQLYARWLNSLTTPELLFRDRLVESPLCHPSVLLRRDALEAAGGWQDSVYPEDWALWLRMLKRKNRLCCVDEVLFRWRDHERRLTRTDLRCRRETLTAFRADEISSALGSTDIVIAGATDLGRALCLRLQRHGKKVTAFVDVNPRKLGQKIHGCPVLTTAQLGKPNGRHLLVCVGAKGARQDIRALLNDFHWTEGIDFTCLC